MTGLEESEVWPTVALYSFALAIMIGALGLLFVESMNMIVVNEAWVKVIQDARKAVILIKLTFFVVGVASVVIYIARKLWDRIQWPGL
ncbi:MAG: hypothetical protein QW251_05955 [Desulfurococcaceae archaeon]